MLQNDEFIVAHAISFTVASFITNSKGHTVVLACFSPLIYELVLCDVAAGLGFYQQSVFGGPTLAMAFGAFAHSGETPKPDLTL